MWHNVKNEPIPTKGCHGKTFILNLEYIGYYGHCHERRSEVVAAFWDSTYECFYESKSGKPIDERDIASWWKDI